MLELAIAAFVVGLAGSPHCVGMCGAFAVSCGGRPGRVAAWQAGKLASYLLIGVLAGAAGASLPGPVWVAQLVSGSLVVWFGLAMAGWVPEPAVTIPGVTRLATRFVGDGGAGARFVLGVANGLLPCGLVYAAAGLAVASGSAWAGLLVMVSFALGTAPLLTAFALSTRTLLARRPAARRALALVLSVAGLWVVIRRGGMLPPMH